MRRVTFLDTSVLTELVRVPGKSQRAEDVKREFEDRRRGGDLFVIPTTAIIETGNHIAQASGDRRGAAIRLVQLIEAARDNRDPFRVHRVQWDEAFLTNLCAGSSTSESFVDLAGAGRMGGGDVAILVERDRFRATSDASALEVSIWTLEAELGAFS